MAEVTLNVGGHSYRLVCRNGEEPALRAAGHYLDGRATSIRDALGSVGEARLLLMAALQVTGELLLEKQQSSAKVSADEQGTSKNSSGTGNELPRELLTRLEELAERAEFLAERLETAAAAS